MIEFFFSRKKTWKKFNFVTLHTKDELALLIRSLTLYVHTLPDLSKQVHILWGNLICLDFSNLWFVVSSKCIVLFRKRIFSFSMLWNTKRASIILFLEYLNSNTSKSISRYIYDRFFYKIRWLTIFQIKTSETFLFSVLFIPKMRRDSILVVLKSWIWLFSFERGDALRIFWENIMKKEEKYRELRGKHHN